MCLPRHPNPLLSQSHQNHPRLPVPFPLDPSVSPASTTVALMRMVFCPESPSCPIATPAGCFTKVKIRRPNCDAKRRFARANSSASQIRCRMLVDGATLAISISRVPVFLTRVSRAMSSLATYLAKRDRLMKTKDQHLNPGCRFGATPRSRQRS